LSSISWDLKALALFHLYIYEKKLAEKSMLPGFFLDRMNIGRRAPTESN